METDVARAWTLGELADIACLSGEHLRRLCRKELGRSPMQHLTHLRLQRARHLLSITDDKVEVIARAVGFESAFTFSNTFYKWIGWRPSEFRGCRKSSFVRYPDRMYGFRHGYENLIVLGNREHDLVELLICDPGDGMIGNGMTDWIPEYDAGEIRSVGQTGAQGLQNRFFRGPDPKQLPGARRGIIWQILNFPGVTEGGFALNQIDRPIEFFDINSNRSVNAESHNGEVGTMGQIEMNRLVRRSKGRLAKTR